MIYSFSQHIDVTTEHEVGTDYINIVLLVTPAGIGFELLLNHLVSVLNVPEDEGLFHRSVDSHAPRTVLNNVSSS